MDFTEERALAERLVDEAFDPNSLAAVLFDVPRIQEWCRDMICQEMTLPHERKQPCR